jgi:predicted RNase H-like HicB family nuclease
VNFPVAIHKDPASDYGVTVPDLPGCFSAGETFDEALDNAREAIELHLEGMIDEGMVIPQAEPVENHLKNRDYKGAIWGMVSINPATLRLKAIRINVTIPERTLDVIDSYAAQHGQTRSGLLAEAAMAYIGREESHPKRKLKPGRRPAKNKK